MYGYVRHPDAAGHSTSGLAGLVPHPLGPTPVCHIVLGPDMSLHYFPTPYDLCERVSSYLASVFGTRRRIILRLPHPVLGRATEVLDLRRHLANSQFPSYGNKEIILNSYIT
jgi:hypothetical protein